MKRVAPLSFLLCLVSACGGPAGEDAAAPPLFTRLSASETGIAFRNGIIERDGFNVLEYEYFYNGGGVAAGDVNGDGLPDLYFSANMDQDRLYLNRGGLVFEDVTEQAGLVSEFGWTTGVTMGDINGDGHLDIYVCKSGRVSADRRRNALYVNNGDGTFTERAAEYGLDDPAYSNHVALFDYDRDGDLDLYLLNHSIRRLSRFYVDYMRSSRDSLVGDKLYRNDGGSFTDVSEAAGIIGNPLGFGLSVIVGDLNRDAWPDLYVSNDYIEDDYLYVNNGDGTFTESVRSFLTHTSYSSMGADIADVNNDALPDIVTLDMLAEDHFRQKVLQGPQDHVFYEDFRSKGFHEQYMRNMLQLNRGDGAFTEIGQLAGVSNTDWSWAALLADFDLDGYNDLFVTNGYMRDYTDLDFLRRTLVNAHKEASARGEALSSLEMVRQMPSNPLSNYIYRNESGIAFADKTRDWGVGEAAFSNGAAYADLDDDGDIDLVVNNINTEAFVYRNDADRLAAGHYLKVRLEGSEGNRFGVGAAVEATGEGRRFYREMNPVRGYLSSVEPVLFFGLGELEQVDLEVIWPDGARQRMQGVPANQTVTLHRRDAGSEAPDEPETPQAPPFFVEAPDVRGLRFVHEENPFVDFEREPFLPHMLSRQGPALAAGDADGDGLEDVFVGGARGQSGALFLQRPDGSFRRGAGAAFEAHSGYEDTDALFMDADGDGDQDLYVVSGGSFEAEDMSAYQDRLYVNAGEGVYAHDAQALPALHSSGGTVAAHDFDMDGDLDLFAGGRALPGRYPLAPQSYLLENTGGTFVDVTPEALRAPGMVTDALWMDMDGDQRAELVLAGEWMPIRAFRYTGEWAEIPASESGFTGTAGWWNALRAQDLDGDGDVDLVAGNRGLNAQMQASPDKPAAVYSADFGADGRSEFVMGYYFGEQRHPVPWRDELLEEIPLLARQFPDYASYARATLGDVFSEVEPVIRLEASRFVSSVFENTGEGRFRMWELPVEVQFAPVHAILFEDADGDGQTDILLAGNAFEARVQWGRYNGGRGLLLLNRGGMTWESVSASRSGFLTPGVVRGMVRVVTVGDPLMVVAQNDAALKAFVPGAGRTAP